MSCVHKLNDTYLRAKTPYAIIPLLWIEHEVRAFEHNSSTD